MLKRIALVTMVVALTASMTVGGRSLAAQQTGGAAPAGGAPGDPGRPAGAQTAPGTPPAAAQDQQPPAQPTFRAGINFVRVDVIATDNKGNAVIDLMPDDLTVTEDGKPQVIESFKRIKVDERKETTPAREIRTSFDEESEAQREDVRLFAIFLDDYHVRRGASMYARQPLMRFLQNQRSSDSTAASSTTRPGTSSRRSTPITRPSWSSGCATRCRSRRCDRS